MTAKTMPEVKVGDHATGSYLTDCYPHEVVKVSDSGKTIWLRPLGVNVVGGPYEYGTEPDYELYSDPERDVIRASWRSKRGVFVGSNGHGMRFWIGHARYYRDPHF